MKEKNWKSTSGVKIIREANQATDNSL